MCELQIVATGKFANKYKSVNKIPELIFMVSLFYFSPLMVSGSGESVCISFLKVVVCLPVLPLERLKGLVMSASRQ